MSELSLFTFRPVGSFEYCIRLVQIDGQPWFVAADVCRALGLAERNGGFIHHLCNVADDERRKAAVLPLRACFSTPKAREKCGRGGLQSNVSTTMISESGLYKLSVRSKKPQARAFQNWVTRIVLPAISQDGAYVMGEKVATGEMDKDELIARAVQAMQRELVRVEARKLALTTAIAALAPLAATWPQKVTDASRDSLSVAASPLLADHHAACMTFHGVPEGLLFARLSCPRSGAPCGAVMGRSLPAVAQSRPMLRTRLQVPHGP